MIENFPHDAIPDGAALAPHHAYVGLLLALLAVALVWDDAAGKEPWAVAAGIFVALFAFASIWPYYAATGAVLALFGVAVAVVAPVALQFWQSYPWIGPRGVALLGALVAVDDVVEHAFGVATPLDWLWQTHIVQYIS